jgi:pimeloyl-ACP methyl ester carboxylesterase
MTKDFIKNRKGQKLAVVTEQPNGGPKGLVFLMHGLGGFKEQEFIRTAIGAFLENRYTAVSFDTTNTFGESEGNYEDATLTNYYEDLVDVINWAKTQQWYIEPFVLAGHSFGGFCTAYYSENYPNQVKAVAPISATVSGKLSIYNQDPKELEEWRSSGWLIAESQSKPGVIKKLRWNPHEQDRLKYDLLPKASNLSMPVLIIVGSDDTALKANKLLFDKIPGKKEFYIIEKAPHTFRKLEHLDEIKEIFDRWIKNL